MGVYQCLWVFSTGQQPSHKLSKSHTLIVIFIFPVATRLGGLGEWRSQSSLLFFATFLPRKSRRLAVLGYKITTLKWQALHPHFLQRRNLRAADPFLGCNQGAKIKNAAARRCTRNRRPTARSLPSLRVWPALAAVHRTQGHANKQYFSILARHHDHPVLTVPAGIH